MIVYTRSDEETKEPDVTSGAALFLLEFCLVARGWDDDVEILVEG